MWYENYRELSGRKITKNAFAKLLGFNSFTDVKKNYSELREENKPHFKELLGLVKGLKDSALHVTLTDHIFSLDEDKTLHNVLNFLAAKGLASETDVGEFRTHNYSNFSVSLKNIIQDVVGHKDLVESYNLIFNDHVKLMLAQHFITRCDGRLYKKILTSEMIVYAIDESNFPIVYQTYLKTLNTNYERENIKIAKLIFKRATEDGLATYEEVAEILKANKSAFVTEYGGNEASPIISATDSVSKLTETATWLGNKEIAQDKVCMDFFMEHCNPETLSLKKKRRREWIGGLPFDDSVGSVDISNILMSKSMIAPPVLASYLLYNIGSIEFSIERFYAILYVIQRLPVLRPFVESLEPIHRIESTRKYENRDLQNSLSATFLLINKIKLLDRDVDDYISFVHELFSAKQHALVIGESMRMIEAAKLMSSTKLDNAIYHAVNEIDEQALKNMPLNCLHAAYILILRGTGQKAERLIPFIDEKSLSSYDKLANKDLQHALERPQTGRLEKHQEVRRFLSEPISRDAHYGFDSANHLEGLLRSTTLDDIKISFENIEVEYKGQSANYFHLNRGSYRFDITQNIIEHNPFGKLIENLGFFKYIGEDDIALACYLNEEKIRGKKWINKEDRDIYIFKEGRLVASANIHINTLFRLIIKLRPHTVELASMSHYYDRDYRYLSGEDNEVSVTMSVLKFSNLTDRVLDAFTLHYEFFSEVDLSKFFNYNPLQAEVKKHLPRFYFYGKTMNEEGREYQ
ncbi:MAG: hypothetical protein CMN72_00415 [Sphingomonas sp.]|nr:hypothetical protein [Sphingomonas sp.]|tara:strand:+ start:1269 stop:3512 length:2244 start_codon:yes stop_codon:yes gene_type:complete